MPTNTDFILKMIQEKFNLSFKRSTPSKYLQISNFIKERIDEREIPVGHHLPTTRKLAETLNVSRSTVIKAYEQLQIQGIIKAKQGSGYLIRDRTTKTPVRKFEQDPGQYPSISKKGKLFKKNVSLIHSTSEKFVAFRPGVPPLDVFPVGQWKRLSNLYWRNIKYSSLSFSDSSGIESLKKNIANYLSLIRGIQCDYEQIVIVSGSLQSLYLISNALLNQNDTMVLENPTFPNVHSIFRSLGANLKPLGVDDNGIKINDLELEDNERPKLIHLTPSNHYPTGVQMSYERKLEVLKWADQHKAIIIENDYDHEISNWNSRQESIFSLDNKDRTVFLGTFNRLLHQSVRLGYMVVPYYLLDVIKALQKHSHRFVSPSNQLVMSQFIEKNYLYNHICNVIEVAEERKAIFLENFKKYMHPSVQLKPSQARSLHLLTEIPDEVSDKKITEDLRDINITAHHYSKCFMNDSKNGLIFGYSCVKSPKIINKIRKVSEVYDKAAKDNLLV
jgi:GntR family transcriptional regulator/MocR family aminotransferase